MSDEHDPQSGGQGAMGHLGRFLRDLAGVGMGVGPRAGRSLVSPAPRTAALVQLVQYVGKADAVALEDAADDEPEAAAADFRRTGTGEWLGSATRPTLVVEYRFDAPEIITRRVHTASRSAQFEIDTNQRIMAQAGYVLEHQEWGGDPYIATSVAAGQSAGLGGSGYGVLVMTYRYDPEATGEPECAIVFEEPDGSATWRFLDRPEAAS
jgi:hypothetical protein